MSLYTLTVDLLLKSGSFERDSGKAARVVKRDMDTIQASMSDASRRGADEVSAGFRRVAFEAVGMTSALAAVKAVIGKADEWTNLNNRLRLVTKDQAAFVAAQQDVVQIAKSTRQPLGATAELYQRIAMNQDALGLSGAGLARVVETISKTMVISGSSAAAAEGALIQLGQAFASGALRGEELNSVLEGAPALAQEIAKGLNVPMGKLRELGQAGKLSADQVISALQRQAGAVDEAFGKMDATVGQSLTLLNTNLSEMIGRADDATGASQALAAGIGLLGSNLQTVAVASAAVASGPLVKALLSRVAAANAAVAADRAAAAQSLAAAQQLELRTRAAMLDAQAEARRMQVIGGSVSVSAKAAAATLEHRQATLLLAQAQTQAAAANAGWLARAGSATLSVLGGPAGIVTMLATAAAGWLLFRDNTNTASAALIDFGGAADVAIEKFRELNRQQQAGEILRLQKEIGDGYKEITATIRDMALESQRSITNSYSDAYAASIRRLADELKAGKLSADEFSARLEQANAKVLEGATGAERFRGRMVEQTASVATLARETERQGNVLESLNAATTQAKSATDALSGSFNVLGDSAGAAGKRIASAMQSLPGQLARVGKSAAEVAKLDVNDWFKEAQASGVDFSKRDDPKVKQYIEQGAQYILLQTELAAAQKNFTESRKASAAAERAGAKDRKADAEAIKRYNEQAAMAAATMAGPLAEATERQKQLEDKLKEALKEGRIERGAYNTLVLESQKALEQSSAEIKKALASPEALLATMDAEVAMLGKVGRARELSRREMMNERDMRQELQKAVEAAGGKEALALSKGAASYEQYEKAMLDAARASADLSLRAEEAAANVEAWAGVVINGVGDAADAMADFVAGGMRDFDNLWDDLKDAAKRGLRDLAREFLQQRLVIPIQTQLLNGLNAQGGGLSLQSLIGVLGGNGSAAGGQNAGAIASLLSIGQGAIGFRPGASAAVGGFGQGSSMAFGNNVQGFIGGGRPSRLAGINWGGALTGGMLGLQGGDGLFSKGLSTLAGGLAGNAVSGAISAGMAAYKGGSGLMGALTGGLKSIGPAGWIGLGAFALDKVTGGGLFGTSWKTTGGASQFNIGAGGVSGVNEESQSKKRSLFRGSKSRTNSTAMDDAALGSVRELFEQIEKAMGQGAAALGITVPPMISGSFRQEFDKNGNLTKQFGQIAGRVYNEAEDAFAKRLAGENVLAVAKAYGSADEIERIAQKYRGDAAKLNDVAGLTLSIQADIANATQLWNSSGDGTITRVVERMGDLARAGETMNEAYARLTGAARDYGALMADVSTQLLTGDLSQYQSQALSIERTYRQQVKSANDYAKALGLSGARAEDLAKIEALRATNMGKLQAQIDKDKKAAQYGLAISDLSPLTDQEKLGEAMKELERAVAGGDTSAAQAAAQAALGFGRNLYASGQDFNSLYGRVTGLIDGMKVGDLDLKDGTSMGALADAIEALPDNFSRAVFDLVVNNDAQTQTTAAVQQSNALLAEQNQLLRQLVSTTTQGVRTASSSALREALNAR
ncbi:tape measure protein [Stenotrophomonas maltophilia]|uniref:tape measure protein n=1 Tax=Stenotrophomonas maltophilia TaxID=40324 RepID=UPI003B5D5EF0